MPAGISSPIGLLCNVRALNAEFGAIDVEIDVRRDLALNPQCGRDRFSGSIFGTIVSSSEDQSSYKSYGLERRVDPSEIGGSRIPYDQSHDMVMSQNESEGEP